MKTYECQVCGHVAFDQAPVDCPVCGMAIENFESDPDAIKTPLDPDNLNETDKKHIPRISVDRQCGLTHVGPCINVQVRIGEIEHVMESEHFIDFIDFYIDRKYITRVMFTAKKSYPVADMHFHISKGTLSVIAHCNVHGDWRAKIKLDDE